MFGVQAWVGPQSTLRRYWGHMLKIHGTAPHSRHTSPSSPCAGAGVCYRCGRARWRKHLFRRPRWALLLGRGRPDPRGMPRGWATRLPPHAPAHVLSHPWRAARAKAPSRARRSVAQLAWEAAAAQRCRAPTGELGHRWTLAEAGSGGACPAKAPRAARELLLSWDPCPLDVRATIHTHWCEYEDFEDET